MTAGLDTSGILVAGLSSHLAAAAMYALLTALLVSGAGRNAHSRRLIVACAVTAGWALAFALHAYSQALPSVALFTAEILRLWVWILFLAGVTLNSEDRLTRFLSVSARTLPGAVLAVGLILAAAGRLVSEAGEPSGLVFTGPLLLCVVGLVLVEQVYRNTEGVTRWAVKFLCLGLAAMLAYDVFLYSQGLLYKHINADFWAARGVIIVLTVPLVAIAARRNPDWSLDIFVSRQAAYYSASLIAVALYLLVVALGGYYIKLLGRSWGDFIRVVFIFGSFLGLVVVITSSQVRAELRVFLAKHFYRNKYEYRDEWLRLIGTLDADDAERDLVDRAARAMVEVVGGPSGVLWLKSAEDRYAPAAVFDCPKPASGLTEPVSSSLSGYLRDRDWIIDIDEALGKPTKYPGLDLPDWASGLYPEHLIVPIKQGADLAGFAVVKKPVHNFELTFEDIDLLRTVGRQIASYLYLETAMNRLAESRQFEAFNRLSGFLMHDLKNIVSQQSLVVQNAARHKNDPRFVDDAIATIENSVARMKRLLAQIESKSATASLTCPNLSDVVRSAVKCQAGRKPVPALNIEDDPIRVLVDEHRCQSVLEHLITNAQDATPEDGSISVSLCARDGMAVLRIQDTGAGMEPEFVAEKLFKPFFTTKGAQGMGIGAYQAREFVREAGGRLEVESRVGDGTCFSIFLPIHQDTR